MKTTYRPVFASRTAEGIVCTPQSDSLYNDDQIYANPVGGVLHPTKALGSSVKFLPAL